MAGWWLHGTSNEVLQGGGLAPFHTYQRALMHSHGQEKHAHVCHALSQVRPLFFILLAFRNNVLCCLSPFRGLGQSATYGRLTICRHLSQFWRLEVQAQDSDRSEGQLSDSQMVPSYVFMRYKD